MFVILTCWRCKSSY